MFLRELTRGVVQKIRRSELAAILLRVRAPECIGQKLADGLGAPARFFRFF